jgi:hypothetical protein
VSKKSGDNVHTAQQAIADAKQVRRDAEKRVRQLVLADIRAGRPTVFLTERESWDSEVRVRWTIHTSSGDDLVVEADNPHSLGMLVAIHYHTSLTDAQEKRLFGKLLDVINGEGDE